jgi:ribose transport system ATP-binding protein
MPILEARNITKLFPGVTALKSVSIAFDPGSIHCVIGENGAGKSTLIKCLTGVYSPESGQVFVENREAGRRDRACFKKIAYVPQEIDLFNHLSVAENLFLPYDGPEFSGLIHQGCLEEMAKPFLEKFRIRVRPDDLVHDISISAQQLLQIARATVNADYQVLMLDEPTTSLTTDDTKILFDIIREIKRENKAIIFISHKLEEIFELGDEITIMRNGENVYHSPLSEIDIPGVITRMTGRAIDQGEVFHSAKVSEEKLLEVDTLTGEKFTKISFDLKRGEILGFYGLVGAGRTELMQAIFGYLPVYAGRVKVEGVPWQLGDTNYSVQNGLIYLPEERKKYGILPMLSIRENISISILDTLKNLIGICPVKENAVAADIIKTYDVKTPDAEKAIQFLSGGNQQKVIIGRSMVCSPKILIFDEPTKGIDVGTKTEIYRMMKQVAEEHALGIILISSEMEEVQKCSNRIIVMYDGRKAGEFPAGAGKEDILSAVIGIGGNPEGD